MNFTSPESLVFWTTLIFIVFFILMKKVAWKPILQAVKSREENINKALDSAEQAKKEMQNLVTNNNKLLAEAKIERDAILRDAREIKEKIIVESKEQAQIEANKILEQAKQIIINEKMAAITDLKNQVASISIEIAEKILTKELSDKKAQTELVDTLIKNSNLN